MKNLGEVLKKNILGKILFIFLIVLLLIIIFLVYSYFSASTMTDNAQMPIGHVYINEIMTNNSSYPDQRGVICDWVELYNSSNNDIDISGYKLFDNKRKDAYTIPKDTIIEANNYLLISFGEGDGDLVAHFALSKKGHETLTLSNQNDQVLDAVLINELDADFVMARNENNTWVTLEYPTPLFENNYKKYNSYINNQKSLDSPILITEVMSDNLNSVLDSNGNPSDWIEITNVSDESIDLDSYFITNKSSKPYRCQLPQRILAPNESILVFASGDSTANLDEIHLDFRISSIGETLYLFNWRGIEVDMVNVPQLLGNYSYVRDNEGVFSITPNHTPGYKNNTIPNTIDLYNCLYISEVCPINRSGIKDDNDEFSDWIEITNTSDTVVTLNNCWLSTKDENVYQFQLPNIKIQGNESIIIFASGTDNYSNEIHSNFSLSSYGETIVLYTSNGYPIDTFEYQNATQDISFVRITKNDIPIIGEYITPNYQNNVQGHREYMDNITRISPLLINEVMTSNSKYLPQAFGRCYDWIELINMSDIPINLDGYTISDDLSHPNICQLPNITLEPKETFIVICSEDSQLSTEKTFFADFVLSAEYSPLYLFDEKGNTVDWMTLRNIPPDTSYGRLPEKSGFFNFINPSPNKENSNGLQGVSKTPEPSIQGGQYPEIDNLTIELLGDGDIHYTLDGTIPTMYSRKYISPIQIEETTAIRAISIQENMIQSDILNISYFLNTNHSLPILSLSIKDSDMFSDSSGIYVKGNSLNGNYYLDWEKQVNLTLYDLSGDGFSIDCGLKMHGGGSRASDEKKSLKVNFRPKYGQGRLVYDLFDESTPREFSSLVIRAGEDYRHTVFRSELISGLAKDANPQALTQTHKYCVLYVNGDYFGIFALMERYNEEYYAARYNVTPESVSIVGTYNLESSSFKELIDYCANNDIREQAHYEYIEQRVDIDILIDWCIFQAYSSNTDISYNVRLINSTQGDGKWRYCLYDLDWTMRKEAPNFDRIFKATNIVFSLPKYLIKNVIFQQQLYARAEQLRYGVLSNENVLTKIEEYDVLLRPELPHDRQKWNRTMTSYEKSLEILKSMIRDYDRWESLMNSLDKYCNS